MKVCFISHSAGLRGAERALIEAVLALQQHGVRPVVFVPSTGPLVDLLGEQGVEVVRFWGIPWVTTRPSRGRSLVKLVAISCAVLGLIPALKKTACDLVYSNTLAVPTGALAAAWLNVPHLWHFHEFGFEDHGFVFDSGDRAATSVIRRFGGHLLFNSEAVRSKWLGLLEGPDESIKSDVIYQSVVLSDAADMANPEAPSGVPTLVLVGALHPNKGQRDAFLATQELVRRGLKCNLVLVGDGPDRGPLEALGRDLGIDGQVSFTGEVEDVSHWYSRADIVLVCSASEAFGRVAVEAMLSKKPVIAAASGGVQEVVSDQEDGLVYKPGDYKDLADRVQFLLDNPTVATRLAEKGYRHAQARYSPERYGEELFRLLTKVAQEEES